MRCRQDSDRVRSGNTTVASRGDTLQQGSVQKAATHGDKRTEEAAAAAASGPPVGRSVCLNLGREGTEGGEGARGARVGGKVAERKEMKV